MGCWARLTASAAAGSGRGARGRRVPGGPGGRWADAAHRPAAAHGGARRRLGRGDRPLRPVRARQRHARRPDRGRPRRLSRRRGHRLLPVRAGRRPCPPRRGRRRRHADRPPAGARALGRRHRGAAEGRPAGRFRHRRLGSPVRRTRAARDLVGVRPPRRRRLRRHRAAGGGGPGGGRTGPGSERAGAAGRRGPAGTEPAPGIHIPESSPSPRRPAGVSPIAPVTGAAGGTSRCATRARSTDSGRRRPTCDAGRYRAVRAVAGGPHGGALTERGSGDAGGRRRRWQARANCRACATGDRCRRRRLAHHPCCTGHGGGCRAKGRALGRACPRRQGARHRGCPGSRSSSSPTAATWRTGPRRSWRACWPPFPAMRPGRSSCRRRSTTPRAKLPPDKALAYNQWLAERRQSRVEDWLGTRPGAPVLRVRRSVLPHDPSRRVVISARPLP